MQRSGVATGRDTAGPTVSKVGPGVVRERGRSEARGRRDSSPAASAYTIGSWRRCRRHRHETRKRHGKRRPVASACTPSLKLKKNCSLPTEQPAQTRGSVHRAPARWRPRGMVQGSQLRPGQAISAPDGANGLEFGALRRHRGGLADCIFSYCPRRLVTGGRSRHRGGRAVRTAAGMLSDGQPA